MPPGKLPVTGKARPARNTLPPRFAGTVVTQVLVAVSNAVVAVVAVGEKVIVALGTGSVCGQPFTVKSIAASVTRRVTGLAPTPLALRTLLNQMWRPAGIGVPLKLDWMKLAVERRARSSRCSNRRGAWRRA